MANEKLADQTRANNRFVDAAVQKIFADAAAQTAYTFGTDDKWKLFYRTDTGFLYLCNDTSGTLVKVNGDTSFHLVEFGATGMATNASRFLLAWGGGENTTAPLANTGPIAAQMVGAGSVTKLILALDTAYAAADVTVTLQTGATRSALADTALTGSLVHGAVSVTLTGSINVNDGDLVAVKVQTSVTDATSTNPRAVLYMLAG